MRRALGFLLAISLAGSLSCSNTITAPAKPVTVTGVIRDRGGAPMPGVNVIFDPSAQTGQPAINPSAYLTTDANGSFRVALAAGKYDVRIYPDYDSGYPAVYLEETEFGAANNQLNYTFAGALLSGDVTGLGGSPVDGGFVHCSSAETYATATTKNGRYSFVLPPGTYFMNAEYNREKGFPTRSAILQLSSSDTTMDFNLMGNEVTVSLALEGGPALQGAYVSASSDVAGVSAANRSALDGTSVLFLPDGDYIYAAVAPEENIVSPIQGPLTVSGATSAAIYFPGTKWDITVRRASDNTPLALAWLYATELGTQKRAGDYTDSQGQVRLYVRPNTIYTVNVYPPNSYNALPGPYVSTIADSTFDVVVDVP